jgi:hypothetical protein
MSPDEQLLDQVLGDRPLVEETAEQALAEQLHQPLGLPLRRRVPRAVGASAAVGGDQVQVRMPLQEVSCGGDRDHDPGPRFTFAAGVSDQLLDGLGASAGELAEQLPPAPEQRPQQAWDGEYHAAHSSCFFFSHEGQKLRPRQEKATSTLLRHSPHQSLAKPCSRRPHFRNSRSTRSTTGRSAPC